MSSKINRGQSASSINWNKWGNVYAATLQQLVLLSLGIDPDALSASNPFPHQLAGEFRDRMEVVMKAMGWHQGSSLLLEQSTTEEEAFDFYTCRLSVFGAWARALPKPWALPDEFPGGSAARVQEPIEITEGLDEPATRQSEALGGGAAPKRQAVESPQRRPPGVPTGPMSKALADFFGALYLHAEPDDLRKLHRFANSWTKAPEVAKRLRDAKWLKGCKLSAGKQGPLSASTWHPVELVNALAKRAGVSLHVFEPIFNEQACDQHLLDWRPLWLIARGDPNWPVAPSSEPRRELRLRAS